MNYHSHDGMAALCVYWRQEGILRFSGPESGCDPHALTSLLKHQYFQANPQASVHSARASRDDNVSHTVIETHDDFEGARNLWVLDISEPFLLLPRFDVGYNLHVDTSFADARTLPSHTLKLYEVN